MPRIEPAFGLYVKLLLVFGLIFQMPTLVLFLARMGVITARFLIRNMKYAILIMFIVGAVLSPGTDPVGQALMAGPMFVLYLLSIALAWIFGKKRRKASRRSVACGGVNDVVRPISRPSEVDRLIADLDSPDPVRRDASVARLRVLGARAASAPGEVHRVVQRIECRARLR